MADGGLSDAERLELSARWQALAHAMQSGVAAKMEIDPDGATTPKHLRVGVNVALRDHGSLVALLVSKGVITEREYLEAIIKGMGEEVRVYESELTRLLGRKVTLQ